MKLSFVCVFLLSFIIINVNEASYQRNRHSCPKRCPKIPGCSLTEKCPFGDEAGFCNCCKRCLKGLGEICGGPGGNSGNCAKDLFCEKLEGENIRNPEGICKKITPVLCFAPCGISPCPPSPFCKFGSTKDPCGCCDVCLPGLHKSCDDKGLCGGGLYCDQSSRYPSGICKTWSFYTYPPYL